MKKGLPFLWLGAVTTGAVITLTLRHSEVAPWAIGVLFGGGWCGVMYELGRRRR